MLLTFSFVFSVVLIAFAGVRIDKPKIRVLAKGGSYSSGEIKVENTGKDAIDIKVYLEDWVYAQSDGGKEFFPKNTTPLSCAGWITYFPADIRLEGGKSTAVNYTVSVPENTRGGHYCVMFFETGGGEIEQTTQEGSTAMIKVLNRVGALFYVEAEGTVNKTGKIDSISINQKLNDFLVGISFMNTGNTDITASGTFDVLDDKGFVYVRGAFPEIYTLPADKADVKSSVPSVNLVPGQYDIIVTLDFENGGSLVQEAGFTVGQKGEISDITLKQQNG